MGEAAQKVIAEYPKGDPMSEKIHDSYFEYIKKCAAVGNILEGQMYKDRAAVWGV